MILLWVINIILVMTCSAMKCTRVQMTKEMTSTEQFTWKLRKVYANATNRLDCIRLCVKDERCNGILVCPGVCHLFGVLNVNSSSPPVENSGSCDVFVTNYCQKDGFPDDNGYCVCPRGYGGPYCENVVQDVCYNQWQMVYNSTGSPSLDAFSQTAEKSHMYYLKYVLTGNKINAATGFGKYSQSVWVRSLYELNKGSWNSFVANPLRAFRNFLDGKYAYLMLVSLNDVSVETHQGENDMVWYSKEFAIESECFQSPSSSPLPANDRTLLVSRIRNGSSVAYNAPLYIQQNEEVIVVELHDRLDETLQLPYLAVTSPPVWQLIRYSTNNYIYFFPWYIGGGPVYPGAAYPTSYTWCTDDCWMEIFAADEFSTERRGSVSLLGRALLSGHKLRVYFGGVALDAKSVYIHGQSISACLQEMLEPANAEQFNESATAQRKIVSSDGMVQTRKYTFETDTVLEDLEEQLAVTWFVDTREWIQALVVKGDGVILNGSVADLHEKVLQGASVRIVVEFLSGMFQIVDVDNLEVSLDAKVAAEIIYHVNVEYGEDYIRFAPTSVQHLWSAIITTDGEYTVYLYTYKQNVGVNKILTPDVYKCTWFIQV